MPEQHEYVKEYLESLPMELRPDVNERLKNALRDAWRNGWSPKNLAQTVAKSNYSNATSPAGVALVRLERFCKEKFTFFPNGFVQTNFSDAHCRIKGCVCKHVDCYRGWIDGGIRPVGVGEKVVEYDYTSPCPTCRAGLVERLNTPDY